MTIQIDPEALFSTSEVSRMLNIDGLTGSRVKLLCDRGKVPYVLNPNATGNRGGRYTHFRIAFKHFPDVIEAHRTHRTIGVVQSVGTSNRELAALEDRVQWLEKALLHELGISRVDQEPAPR